MGKVCADNLRSLSCLPSQGKRHVASSAAEIEHACIRALQDVVESSRRATPPQAIHIQGENMVQQVVAGRDGSEHLAHGTSGGVLIASAFGRRSDDWGVVSGHDAWG